MKTEDVVAGLIERFPESADRVNVWAGDYYHALSGYEGQRLQAAFEMVMADWRFHRPPKPAEIVKQIIGERAPDRPSFMYADLAPDDLKRKHAFWKDRAEGGVGTYGYMRLCEEIQRRGYLGKVDF